ncbi:MAG: hypothetical protein ACOYEV_09825 [Candidatus Nanopelagicales bacterium]
MVQPLPADAILLHIGVHKTGTTALQAAFAAARPQLSASGVSYPGDRAAHHGPAMAVLERSWGWQGAGGQHTRRSVFDRLARHARASPGRVFISSEQFCEADDEQAARVVAGLGAGRLHVLLTLRPLAELLPSSYQQYLKYGLQLTFGKWLENTLATDGRKPASPSFWRRNDHAAVVTRWVGLLGPERVRVIVLDPAERALTPRTVAALLDVRPALLTARMGLTPNRSLTASEAEFLRQLNRRLRPALDWAEYERLVREGVVPGLLSRDRDPGEPALRTPAWALREAGLRGAQAAAAISAAGVPVIGDVSRLGLVPEPGPALDPAVRSHLPMSAAVAVIAESILNPPPKPNRARALVSRIRR